MNKSFQVALGGVMAALSLAIMLLTGFIPIGTYACPALAGILLIAGVIELGAKWAWAVFAAISILSLFFAGDKEAALYFVMFFGFYPILKARIETLAKKWPQRILKLAVFNASMVAAFFLALYVFSVPAGEFVIFGIYIPWLFLLAGNVFFIVYDIAVTRLVILYVRVWRKHLFKGIRKQ